MRRFLESPVNIMVDKRVCEKIKFLEEENKKLKTDLAFEEIMLDNVKAEYESLQGIIKKLNEYNRRLKQGNYDLREQNVKLREEIRFLEECLDNKEKVNKSMRDELQRYKDLWDSWEF